MIDVESSISDDLVKECEKIDGVIRVRVVRKDV
jgi:D-3-phosphoglycerate dehydrogenase